MPKSVLLIITGSIAAVKSLDLIRRITAAGYGVNCVLTKAGQEFVTTMSAQVLSGNKVHGDLFSLNDEMEMGHIKLSRSSDLVVVAPASADIIGKMANGLADDLASTLLLATDKKVLIAPAMNVKMWENKAVARNIDTLRKDGVEIVGPAKGALACGEEGDGRMSEPAEIFAAIERNFGKKKLLNKRKAIVTAGPTFEAIDPVRYIANRSSGKQGYEIARALTEWGVDVTLISGPTNLAKPEGAKFIQVESAAEMKKAVSVALPADIAIFAAAVSDWRVENEAKGKIKKNDARPSLKLKENPDILSEIGNLKKGRPKIVIGFAAETDNLLGNARAKLKKKNCDFIVANDVSGGKVFGDDKNEVVVIGRKSEEKWQLASKREIADKLVKKIIKTVTPSL